MHTTSTWHDMVKLPIVVTLVVVLPSLVGSAASRASFILYINFVTLFKPSVTAFIAAVFLEPESGKQYR